MQVTVSEVHVVHKGDASLTGECIGRLYQRLCIHYVYKYLDIYRERYYISALRESPKL